MGQRKRTLGVGGAVDRSRQRRGVASTRARRVKIMVDAGGPEAIDGCEGWETKI